MGGDEENIYQEMITIVEEELSALEQLLLEVQKQPQSPKLVESIYKHFHHIHSTISFYEFSNLHQLSQNAQDLLQALIDNQGVGLSAIMITTLLTTTDAIQDILRTINKKGEEGDFVFKEISEKLSQLTQAIKDGDASTYNPEISHIQDEASSIQAASSTEVADSGAPKTEPAASAETEHTDEAETDVTATEAEADTTPETDLPADIEETPPSVAHEEEVTDLPETLATEDPSEVTPSSAPEPSTTEDQSPETEAKDSQPIKSSTTPLNILWAEPNSWLSKPLTPHLTAQDKFTIIPPSLIALETALKIGEFNLVVIDPELVCGTKGSLMELMQSYQNTHWLIYAQNPPTTLPITTSFIAKPGSKELEGGIDVQQSTERLIEKIIELRSVAT